VTNREALNRLVLIITSLRQTSTLDAAILKELLFELNLAPQTEGVAELLVRAQLELSPDDTAIRRMAVGQLVSMGKATEAKRIEDGGAFGPIAEGVQEDLEHFGDAIARSMTDALKDGV